MKVNCNPNRRLAIVDSYCSLASGKVRFVSEDSPQGMETIDISAAWG